MTAAVNATTPPRPRGAARSGSFERGQEDQARRAGGGRHVHQLDVVAHRERGALGQADVLEQVRRG